MILKRKKTLIGLLACAFVACTAIGLAGCNAAPQETYNFQNVTVYGNDVTYVSPSAVALGTKSTFVSDATANKLYKMDNEGNVIQAYTFEDAVNGVYVNGSDVYALVGGLAGEIYRFNTSLELQGKAETEHTPNGAIVVGERIYVANRFSNSVSVFNLDLTEGKVIELEEGREPMSLAYAQDKIFVACHLPGGAANEDVVSANVCVIDPESETVTNNIELINGTGGVKDIAVSSDGKYVYLSNLFARYTYPTSQLDRGWINTNGITIVDAVEETVYAGVLLDSVEKGASNPWGIDVIGEGEDAKIVCTISGLAEISIIDEAAMFEKLTAVENDETDTYDYELNEVVDFVGFADDFSERFYVGGNGLRAVELREEEDVAYAYMTQYFDGAIVKVALEPNEDGEREVEQYTIGKQGDVTAERIGEILWYDGNYCYQTWESCASCHPDARADGFNWDNLNDSLGNPKQAKSMLYSHRTPPEMITGARETAELAVRKGMQFIQFNVMGEDLLNCIDSYLKSLQPVESPYLNRDGTLTESAQRGKALYEEYSCNTCHSGPYYTDLQKHASKSLDTDDTWENREFDTPSFVEIWRTAPYMFNGNAATMEDAVRYFIEAEGYTITDQEVTDLANYILSIGDSGEYYGVEQLIFDRNNGDTSLAVQTLVPGRILKTVTVRKQWETDKNAFVKFNLYDAEGNQIGDSVCAVLTDMKAGDYASFDCNFKIPADLAAGSYYEIVILNPDDTTEYLATPLRVYYR